LETSDGIIPKPDDDFINTAMKRFNRSIEYERKNRDLMLEDLKFYNGEQWDIETVNIRSKDARPSLVINYLPSIVDQVIGDIKLNRPRIKTRPEGGSADVDFARVVDGLIRSIESESNAEIAYDSAMEFALICGIGYWRIVTEYSDNDVFNQEIRIRPIANPFSVYFDPKPFDLDKTHADWCFITQWIPRDQFVELYPGFDATSLPEVGKGDRAGWYEKEQVRVAEYFIREPEKKTLVLLSDGSIMNEKDAQTKLAESQLQDTVQPSPIGPLKITKTKVVDSFKVKRYLICGSSILEGAKIFPSSIIPIIPVIGKQIIVDGKKNNRGIVRFGKDPQRMYNYWRSLETEVVALQPKTPWLATAKQIEGFENDWKEANTKNISVLRYNPDPSAAGPPQRVEPPQVANGVFQSSDRALNDLRATTGGPDASMGLPGNERTGKAINARQDRGDMGNFSYIDNYTKALKLTGKIILEALPIVYDTSRVERIRAHDGSESSIPINTPGQDQMGNPVMINDLSSAKFGVLIDTGPSYATARREASEGMMQFAQYFPQAAPLVSDLIAKMQDWEYADEIAERLAKTLPPGIKRGDPPPPPQPPPPNVQEQMERVKIAQTKGMIAKIKAMESMMKLQQNAEGRDIKKQVLDILAELFADQHPAD